MLNGIMNGELEIMRKETAGEYLKVDDVVA
jgi:hypothetical protein